MRIRDRIVFEVDDVEEYEEYEDDEEENYERMIDDIDTRCNHYCIIIQEYIRENGLNIAEYINGPNMTEFVMEILKMQCE